MAQSILVQSEQLSLSRRLSSIHAINPEYLPSIRVLEVICDTYKVQPGDIVEWVGASAPSLPVPFTPQYGSVKGYWHRKLVFQTR
jgi:DNA-binding Xre family transcriptional regulator